MASQDELARLFSLATIKHGLLVKAKRAARGPDGLTELELGNLVEARKAFVSAGLAWWAALAEAHENPADFAQHVGEAVENEGSLIAAVEAAMFS